jgi:hypothetical protein
VHFKSGAWLMLVQVLLGLKGLSRLFADHGRAVFGGGCGEQSGYGVGSGVEERHGLILPF